MQPHSRRLPILLALATLLTACGGSSSNPSGGLRLSSFNLLPTVEGKSLVTRVSGNGLVTIGQRTDNRNPIYWIGLTSQQEIPPSSGTSASELPSATLDGTRFVGTASTSAGVRAFLYNSTDGFTLLPDLAGSDAMNGIDLSDNASVVLGSALHSSGNDEAVQWRSGTPTALPGLAPSTRAVPVALSGNGAYAAGQSNGLPVRWTTGDSPTVVALSSTSGYADDISQDGSVIVGRTLSGSTASAFRWTAADGAVPLGIDVPDPDVIRLAVSGDGTVVVGNLIDSTTHPFIWTVQRGYQDLATELIWDGEPFGGLINVYVRDISRDGKTLVGGGQDPTSSFISRGWKLVLK